MPLSLTIRRLLSTQPIDLPVFHPIAVRILHLLHTPDFTMTQITDLANEDQSLAGQILKMANSPLYIGRVRTETIKEAVVRLGGQEIANLAMAASQASLHTSEIPTINRFLQVLWLHSHACALGSRWLARRAGYPQHGDQAYMAGLLHDIGKLYLLKALERLNRMGVAQAALEEDLLLEIFAELHVEQGCRLMEHWNMPKVYYNVVANHHDENFDTQDIVLTVVRLVNTACRMKGIGLLHDPEIDLFEQPESAMLQLSDEEMDDLLDVLDDSQELVL
ncbi:HDOD domain-containing protein [Geomonas oryzisoli]|uniref:HDOD domain-containing protein n=1 Tax=Geomonas oryzisoli TaxID=2847992 RepID=A0ABX8JB67_9BACT|nr:HDOD domain-containing protein [Geomonas oryzisoli]QWV94391.1 HDOD domain-containing protein [Geomonas oryzisoli]